MHVDRNRNYGAPRAGAIRSALASRIRLIQISAGIAALAAIVGYAQSSQTNSQTTPTQNTNKPYLLPEANRLPDANDQMQMRDQQAKQQNFGTANAERRKQIQDDSEKLVKLATDLKSEVDKTTKDTLSLGVIRKAEEIERLAHGVKEKMKLSVGAS